MKKKKNYYEEKEELCRKRGMMKKTMNGEGKLQRGWIARKYCDYFRRS